MRIGIVSIYSFRPHAEHLAYLARLLEESGHSVYGLTCDAAAPACYGRLLRGRGKFSECPRCMLGGIRSYRIPGVDRIRPGSAARAGLNESRLEQLSVSSAATLSRTEATEELKEPDVRAVQRELFPGIGMAYASAREWIDRRGLDAVIGFNGRMDMTASVAAAVHDAGIGYLSVERTWFGHGLQLIPNANCLSLAESDRMTREFRGAPLLSDQARLAAAQIASRFLRQNELEWRVYNKAATLARWPGEGASPKVLIIPSSNNEFAGHPDWQNGWGDNTKALDELIDRLGIDPGNCVVRCHPNWGERIGRVGGQRSEAHYTRWAESRGVALVPSRFSIDTYDLLDEADLAVLNGGSTALEAAALGKPVICLGPSKYREAGFSIHINGPGEWDRLRLLDAHKPREAARLALRFIYGQMRRFPQFVDYVRAETTTRYRYYAGADAGRIEDMLRSGRVEADDPSVANGIAAEDEVLDMVRERRWQELARWKEPLLDLLPLEIGRRAGLKWLDSLRERLPRGDRS